MGGGRRRHRPLAAALALALAACGSGRTEPDLVLVSVDTLRADRLGAYGHAAARTPTFDGLAARGRLFSQATTPFPRTTPALASLFTGLEPRRHGSRGVGEPRQNGTTLAEILRAHGWATVGVSANGVAGARENLDAGFDRFVEREELGTERAWKVTEVATRLARAVPRSRPLFLWVHYTDPHYSYNPPGEFDPGPAAEPCRALMRRVKAGDVSKGRMQSNHGGATAAALPACSLLYDAEIAYADAEVGRLFEALREAGRMERAYVVYTSDHGENLGEADLYLEHGPSVHDASLRVPLVIAGPDVPAARDTGLVRLEDLAPTLLSLLGVPGTARPAVDGLDLAERVRGRGDLAPELALAEAGINMRVHYTGRPYSGMPDGLHCFHDPPWSLCRSPEAAPALYDHRADPEFRRDLAAEQPALRDALLAASRTWPAGELRERTVRDGRWKLVETPRLAGGWRRALYDLAADPAENRDVAASHPQVTARLGAALERWSATPLPEPAAAGVDLEALRALGYVE